MSEKHGMTNTKEYQSWICMKRRCYDPKCSSYKYYGGRGIKVCDEWNNSFLSFFKDLGYKPSKNHSLDRIDNNKDYMPENCKWSTKSEQVNNRRKFKKQNKIVLLEYNGKKQGIKEWSVELNILVGTIYDRLYRGWSVEKTLSTPTQSQFDSTRGKKQ